MPFSHRSRRAATALAAERSYTPAQLALTYLLQQGDDIVPVHGTRYPAAQMSPLNA